MILWNELEREKKRERERFVILREKRENRKRHSEKERKKERTRKKERETELYIDRFLRMVCIDTDRWVQSVQGRNNCWLIPTSGTRFCLLSFFGTKMAKIRQRVWLYWEPNHIFIIELLSSYMVAWFVTPQTNLTTFDTCKYIFCLFGAVFNATDLWIDLAEKQKQL